MSLKPFEIDRHAHDLILEFREKGDVLGESHKMRMATAYGLERFWGEHLRLQRESRDSRDKADFWKKTWTIFCKIMKEAGINVPNDTVNPDNTAVVKTMTDKLWSFDIQQRKVALAVLTELCDSMVWWTQRYRKPRNVAGGAANGR